MSNGFVKLKRGREIEELIRRRPTAFTLLTIIALRARYSNNEHDFDGLGINEALIGDYLAYGVTEQVYRYDKIFLQTHGFATFRGTSKGTIALLCSDAIYDTNATDGPTDGPTDKQRTSNGQTTTNKKVKKEKKERESKIPTLTIEDFEEIARDYKTSVHYVSDLWDTLVNYVRSTGRYYKDYKAALRNWVRREQKKNTPRFDPDLYDHE